MARILAEWGKITEIETAGVIAFVEEFPIRRFQ